MPLTTHKPALIRQFYAAKNEQHLPTFVLLNGWACSDSLWLPLIDLLVENHNVLTIHITCTESAAEPQHLIDCLVTDIAQVLPDSTYLLGWSLGGMLATKIAQLHPQKIRGLVTLATNLTFVETEKWPAAMAAKTFNEFSDKFFANPKKTLKQFNSLQALGDQNQKTVLAILNKHSPIQKQELDEQTVSSLSTQLNLLAAVDNTEILEQIQCPALHIFGQQDKLVPIVASENISAYKNHKVEILSECGHALHLSQPETVANAVLKFSKSQENLKFLKKKSHIARSFSNAAKHYDQYASLQKSRAEKLIEMAGEISGTVLDIGSGTGFISEEMAKQENTKLIQLDISINMLKEAHRKFHEKNHSLTESLFLAADMEFIPIANSSCNAVLSNMSFQWSSSSNQLFSEIYRVLTPEGRVIFSTVGPETLKELKQIWKQIDGFVHINEFESAENLLNKSIEAGFDILQKKTEIEVLHFDDLKQLLHSVKKVGAQNLNAGQSRSLTGREKWADLQERYERLRENNGKLPLSWEIISFELKKTS